jgi:hypothetical protein
MTLRDSRAPVSRSRYYGDAPIGGDWRPEPPELRRCIATEVFLSQQFWFRA